MAIKQPIVNPAWRNVPSGYTQVESITSNGSQWIDTGITSSLTNEKIITKGKFNQLTGSAFQLFGTDYGSNNAFQFGITNDGKWYSTLKTTSGNNIVADTNTHIFELYSVNRVGGLKIDNNSIYNLTSSSDVSPANLHLFRRNKEDGNYCWCYFTAEYTQIHKDNILVRDYVPCIRNSDSKPCLLDMLTGTPYFNQGTGDDFTYGSVVPQYIGADITKIKWGMPRLPSWLQEVESITSTGTQFFAIPFSHSVNTSQLQMEIEAKLNERQSTSLNLRLSMIHFGNLYYGIDWNNDLGKARFNNTSSTYIDTETINVGTNYNIKTNGSTITINNNSYQIGTSQNLTSSILTIMANRSGYTISKTTLNKYTIKIGTDVYNYVPCRTLSSGIGWKNDVSVEVPPNTKGLYDMAEGKLYINCGSGDDFTCGADVNYAYNIKKVVLGTADGVGRKIYPKTQALIPTMTSNTTPYGVASAKSYWFSENAPYYAFDRNNGWWISYATAGGDLPQWLQYEFIKKYTINRIELKGSGGDRYSQDTTMEIQTSLDGINFNTVSTVTILKTDNIQTFNIPDTKAKYVRFNIITLMYNVTINHNYDRNMLSSVQVYGY